MRPLAGMVICGSSPNHHNALKALSLLLVFLIRIFDRFAHSASVFSHPVIPAAG
jgi:hypothetical protein